MAGAARAARRRRRGHRPHPDRPTSRRFFSSATEVRGDEHMQMDSRTCRGPGVFQDALPDGHLNDHVRHRLRAVGAPRRPR